MKHTEENKTINFYDRDRIIAMFNKSSRVLTLVGFESKIVYTSDVSAEEISVDIKDFVSTISSIEQTELTSDSENEPSKKTKLDLDIELSSISKADMGNHYIFPTREYNPRKEGTRGRVSYDILLGNKNGIPVDQYMNKGGRRCDLKFDIEHGYAYIRQIIS